MTLLPPRPRYSVPIAHRGPLILGERCLVMGILNITPDSFAESVSRLDPDVAVAAALRMEADGADLIDIGGGIHATWRGSGARRRGAGAAAAGADRPDWPAHAYLCPWIRPKVRWPPQPLPPAPPL